MWDRNLVCVTQSYEIKSPPWTILWFRILGIFSVKNIARLGVFMFQTSDNSQLCIDSQYSSQYTANVLLIISIDFAYDQLSPYSLTILFRGCCLYKLHSISSTYYDISLKFL